MALSLCAALGGDSLGGCQREAPDLTRYLPISSSQCLIHPKIHLLDVSISLPLRLSLSLSLFLLRIMARRSPPPPTGCVNPNHIIPVSLGTLFGKHHNSNSLLKLPWPFPKE